MKQSSSDNSNSKDFAQKRTEAELEAQAILKKRNADRRGDAEVEAQSLLNERKNYQQKKDKKIQAQNDLKAKAEARKAKAEAAKVKAEMETRKIEKQLRQKRIDIEKKKHKTKVFGGLAIIIAIAIWGISYFIGNNQEKSETDQIVCDLI